RSADLDAHPGRSLRHDRSGVQRYERQVRRDGVAAQHDELALDREPVLPAGELGAAGDVEGFDRDPRHQAFTPRNCRAVSVTAASVSTKEEAPRFSSIRSAVTTNTVSATCSWISPSLMAMVALPMVMISPCSSAEPGEGKSSTWPPGRTRECAPISPPGDMTMAGSPLPMRV